MEELHGKYKEEDKMILASEAEIETETRLSGGSSPVMPSQEIVPSNQRSQDTGAAIHYDEKRTDGNDDDGPELQQVTMSSRIDYWGASPGHKDIRFGSDILFAPIISSTSDCAQRPKNSDPTKTCENQIEKKMAVLREGWKSPDGTTSIEPQPEHSPTGSMRTPANSTSSASRKTKPRNRKKSTNIPRRANPALTYTIGTQTLPNENRVDEGPQMIPLSSSGISKPDHSGTSDHRTNIMGNMVSAFARNSVFRTWRRHRKAESEVDRSNKDDSGQTSGAQNRVVKADCETSLGQIPERDGYETHRQGRMLRITNSSHSLSSSDDDDSTVQTVQDHFEVPGAHRIRGFLGGYDYDADVIIHEGPEDPGNSLVEPTRRSSPDSASDQRNLNLVEAVPVDENDDVEEQREGNDELDDAVVAEPVSEEALEKGLRGWIRRHRRLTALMTALCVAIVVVLVVFLSLDLPKNPPTEEEIILSSASSRFLDALAIAETVTSREKILSLSTSQYAALTWLADKDEAALDFLTVDPLLVIQRYVLAVTYFSTNGLNWIQDVEFLSSLPECDWKGNWTSPTQGVLDIGVGCDINGYVTSLSLPSANLNGTIPEELGSLPFLSSLLLTLNPALIGVIPDAIFSGGNLTDIRIFDCGLTGTIPENLGVATNLTIIAIQNNDLTGTIPPSIGKLTLLENLFASENQLTGTIPPEMGNLGQAQFVVLNNNLLTGSIPSELLNMTSLRQLDLSFNLLTDGGDTICPLATGDGILKTYVTDCYSQTVPALPEEITCSCCTSCCSESSGSCIDARFD